ncbi:manganese efflux pump [Spirulina subsalsa FACHB-351]|uniref:Manganese efflux pump n=1 Tax=Spirulina subsalsa FACHB-351 TaxID=234711 RepID=A0ABT3L4E3_9CYAN|nr:manganese efflux pump [Spirulina subsalsa]MCW6036367.1 manganese efflux pump [Spirulina subsalsa FACHB-351]
MTLTTLGLISLGLASDTFAVSVSSGLQVPQLNWKKAIQMAFCFGLFQVFMPLLGWGIGQNLGVDLTVISGQLTGILLTFLGLKSLYDGIVSNPAQPENLSLDGFTLLGLAFVLSLDSLGVGVGLAGVEMGIVELMTILGLVTVAFSLLGLWVGHHFGAIFQGQFKVLGGILLVGIGGQILLPHLPF